MKKKQPCILFEWLETYFKYVLSVISAPYKLKSLLLPSMTFITSSSSFPLYLFISTTSTLPCLEGEVAGTWITECDYTALTHLKRESSWLTNRSDRNSSR